MKPLTPSEVTTRGRPARGSAPPSLAAAALAILLCTTLQHAAGAERCGPAPGGPPTNCEAPAAASLPTTQRPSVGAGNPINIITGNKYQREDDMPALPGVLGLEIVRHYNSAYSTPGNRNGLLGRGWRLSYETELVDRFGRIQILQADGRRVIFNKDPKRPDLCTHENPANGSLALTGAGARQQYTWTWPNGRKLHFGSEGKLERIVAPGGEAVTLHYDAKHVLTRVVDPQGRTLVFGYPAPSAAGRFRGVQAIDSPVGRFAYEYGADMPKAGFTGDKAQLLAILVRARLPRAVNDTAVDRVYHHENAAMPWLLTGITVDSVRPGQKLASERLSTYGYDNAAHAILSTHAGDIGKVTLAPGAPGETVLTNSLGQKTVYRYAVEDGEHRLLEVTGAGCSTCSEVNVRYSYNQVGQVATVTQLGDNGQPRQVEKNEFDRSGRLVRVSEILYEKGKPGVVRWKTRFEYEGTATTPALIARPSVIPGKEHQTRFQYNDAAQPLVVTETGWSPAGEAPAVLERTTRYRYARVGGRSLLVAIDGPLPNGKLSNPADSDITLIEYDNAAGQLAAAPAGQLGHYVSRQGLVTKITAPGGFITEVLERDSALRPIRMRTGGATPVVSSIRYTSWGAPQTIDVQAGTLRRSVAYRYNPLRQVQSVTLPGNLTTTMTYDAAGRMNKVILPDGSGLDMGLDTEGALTRSGRFADALAPARWDVAYDRQRPADLPARLIAVRDALGAVRTYHYDDVGQVVTAVSALGIRTKFDYDTAGRPTQQVDAAGTADEAAVLTGYDNRGNLHRVQAPNGVVTERQFDDFGRKVMEVDPDRGATLYRYDVADRLVGRIDETLVTARFTYDNANRLISQGADDTPDATRYQYQGLHLVALVSTPDGVAEHATERLEYERDAFGQVLKETRWVVRPTPGGARAPAQWLKFVTVNSYDAAGRLVHQTLPDGHALQYEFAPGVSAMPPAGARPGQLVRMLFDGKPVASDIEQTLSAGLTGYTLSNGIKTRLVQDGRGRITKVDATASARRWPTWLSWLENWTGTHRPTAPLYEQSNDYDADDRLVGMRRQLASGAGTPPSQIRYGYDKMGRLARVSREGAETLYAYDKSGNRLSDKTTSPGNSTTQSADPKLQHVYSYGTGNNRLVALSYSGTENAGMHEVSASPSTLFANLHSSWAYHPTGVPLAQLAGLNTAQAVNRRIVYSMAKRPVAVYEGEQLLARYYYSSNGERIAKTVYPRRPAGVTRISAEPAPVGTTTFSLYRDQRLAAEADDAGNITAHYLYLEGRPIAKIEMERQGSTFRQILTMLKNLLGDETPTRVGVVYSIVADHLGTPQLVTDEDGTRVWQADTEAFGQARVVHAAQVGAARTTFVLNLRLPGQVFDAETGLHYNYLRDYDPALGRYMTPDPLGMAGGLNPYAYAGADPLTGTDPLGLYQTDVHFNMTYFLARLAGLNTSEAMTVASAAQYIDDNPHTEPINLYSPHTQSKRLAYYHFTQAGFDPSRLHGESAETYAKRRVTGPWNPQLENLYSASNRAQGKCAKIQLFGEFIHTLQDTFSHRDRYNKPVPVNGGLGHGTYGTLGFDPDYTYNHGSLSGYWGFNEQRTFAMEQEVFGRLVILAGKSLVNGDTGKELQLNGKKFTYADIFGDGYWGSGSFISGFNSERSIPAKISMLNARLVALGLGPMPTYVVSEAQARRRRNLEGIRERDNPGTILTTP